ncbi:MAG: Gfo/Idh/MocA family oxidoreductase [Gemmatimonadota bacterium]
MGISLGLVGLGAFGRAFADLFMSHPRVDRIALCDREPERVAAFASKPSWQAKFHPRDAYPCLDAICAADLDALVVITQPWLHAAQCVQALEAGKHVYSAVPVVSLPDGEEILDWCDRIVETCRRTGRHYMLGETTCYRPQAIYCRRRAREGAFGDFVYAEGEYLHDVDSRSNLRQVKRLRLASASGREWLERREEYRRRGVRGGPMHYPTHSTSGPLSVMGARAVRVWCCGWANRTGDEYFADNGDAFSNEVALFELSNGASLRICECREIGFPGREIFRLYGTRGSFENDTWNTNQERVPLTVDQMREPLPEDVAAAFRAASPTSDIYGGHGGSHAYLVHEFVEAVAAERPPAIDAWQAARFMAAGVMAHQSALQGGQVLEVPDWGEGPR